MRQSRQERRRDKNKTRPDKMRNFKTGYTMTSIML